MKSMLLFSALLFLASCSIKNGFYAVPEATKAPPVLTCDHKDALKDHQYRNACVFKVCNIESDANYSKVLAYKKFIDDLTDPTMKKNSFLIHDPSLCTIPILAQKVVFKEPYPSSSANKNSLLSVQPKAVLIGSNDEVLKVAGTIISLSLYKSSDCSGAESDGLSVDAKSLVTNELGEVSFSGVKVSAAGSYSLKVSSANLADDCKAITISDVAEKLAFNPNLISAIIINSSQNISVELRNDQEQIVPQHHASIELSVYSDSSCHDLAAETIWHVDNKIVATVNGVALFRNLYFSSTGSYFLKAKSSGLNPTSCSPLQVNSAATGLSFVTNPPLYWVKNRAFDPISVRLQNAAGASLANEEVPVTLNIYKDNSCTSLATDSDVEGLRLVNSNINSGIAVFSNVKIKQSGFYSFKAVGNNLETNCATVELADQLKLSAYNNADELQNPLQVDDSKGYFTPTEFTSNYKFKVEIKRPDPIGTTSLINVNLKNELIYFKAYKFTGQTITTCENDELLNNALEINVATLSSNSSNDEGKVTFDHLVISDPGLYCLCAEDGSTSVEASKLKRNCNSVPVNIGLDCTGNVSDLNIADEESYTNKVLYHTHKNIDPTTQQPKTDSISNRTSLDNVKVQLEYIHPDQSKVCPVMISLYTDPDCDSLARSSWQIQGTTLKNFMTDMQGKLTFDGITTNDGKLYMMIKTLGNESSRKSSACVGPILTPNTIDIRNDLLPNSIEARVNIPPVTVQVMGRNKTSGEAADVREPLENFSDSNLPIKLNAFVDSNCDIEATTSRGGPVLSGSNWQQTGSGIVVFDKINFKQAGFYFLKAVAKDPYDNHLEIGYKEESGVTPVKSVCYGPYKITQPQP